MLIASHSIPMEVMSVLAIRGVPYMTQALVSRI
jgi:hypothetical protein